MAAVTQTRRTVEPPAAVELSVLRRRAADCTRCPLYARATQTVFGQGSPRAKLMLVGEQPGDAEDRAGEPFVGPAGRLLRDVLDEAGVDPADVYLTNAVKHFKWVERGKRRIHERPNREEVLACRLWLEGEIEALAPDAIVALGSTAASAVIGPSVRVTRDRGRLFPSPLARLVTVTVHPSAILRAPDSAARAEGRRRLLRDLQEIIRRMARP
jgi:DNA polymerase